MNNYNNFDKLRINIKEIFESNIKRKKEYSNFFLIKFFKRYLVAILYKFGIYERLINSGIIIGWFDEFKEYWIKVLGGRPLWFHDFHFLLGIYRQKYQNVEVTPNSTEKQFLEAWQNPEANFSFLTLFP